MVYMSKIYAFLISVLVFVFAVHALALGGFLGYGLWWLDMSLHFLGGLWLAVFAFWFLFERKNYPRNFLPAGLLILGLISFAVLGGVLWEFFEFSWDYFLAKPYHAELAQPSLEDTLSDLFFDLLGAVIVSGFLLYYYRLGFRDLKNGGL